MKVLVINGSPKAKSDTMCLTNAFLEGLTKDNRFEVNRIDIIKKTIKPCVGCFMCWKGETGECFQDDDQKEIMDEYKNADIVIYSFPLYSYAMPSHLKAFVDRLIPFNKMTMKEKDGRIVHVPRVDLSRQKKLFIVGSGFPNFEGNYDGLDIMLKSKFGKDIITLYVSECPMLNEPDARPLTLPLLEKFTKAGEYYAQNLDISPELKKELETPMLDKATYMKFANMQRK